MKERHLWRLSSFLLAMVLATPAASATRAAMPLDEKRKVQGIIDLVEADDERLTNGACDRTGKEAVRAVTDAAGGVVRLEERVRNGSTGCFRWQSLSPRGPR